MKRQWPSYNERQHYEIGDGFAKFLFWLLPALILAFIWLVGGGIYVTCLHPFDTPPWWFPF